MEALILSMLLASTQAAPSPATAPAIPLSYSFGGYPRIQANLHWGTPAGQYIATIFDTGSAAFWVYGPNATINDGSPYHYTPGPCNYSVTDYYNWPASSTHSKLITLPNGGYAYGYGGNGKIISAPFTINDTLSSNNTAWPGIGNTQVALSNYTLVTQGDDGCRMDQSTFDHSILGLAPPAEGVSSVPSFRTNLLKQGKTLANVFAMWFDAPPKDVKGTYKGLSTFGGVPATKYYSGELVRLKESPPQGTYVGYYTKLFTLTANNFAKPGGKASKIPVVDKSVTNCLLDSGTGNLAIPMNSTVLNAVTGLVQLQSPYVTAYNGPCSAIPSTAALNFTFDGVTAGKKVTISLPLRALARGEFDEVPGFDTSKYCGLSFSADEYGGCVLGAPFFTAAYAVFDDDKKEILLAQGGVSQNTASSPSALGKVTVLAKGQAIPGAV